MLLARTVLGMPAKTCPRGASVEEFRIHVRCQEVVFVDEYVRIAAKICARVFPFRFILRKDVRSRSRVREYVTLGNFQNAAYAIEEPVFVENERVIAKFARSHLGRSRIPPRTMLGDKS